MREIQRVRILTAMASACRELDPRHASVAEVVRRAGVSRRTFYEAFTDREECQLAALEEALARVAAQVLPAYRAQRGWRDAVRAGLTALLAFLDSDRTFGSLLIVDSLALGQRALARRAEVVRVLASALRQGARSASGGIATSAITAQSTVGAVLSVLHARLLAQPESAVSPLAGELMAIIVLPYMGPAAASAEMRLCPPRDAQAPTQDDALAALEIRMTYRTVRVLRALAQREGSQGLSNRQVADAAGIADRGQASKLLARLAQKGLIAKAQRAAAQQGAPNCWALTELGARLERATRRG